MKFQAKVNGRWQVIDTLYELKSWLTVVVFIGMVVCSIIGWVWIIQGMMA